MGTLGYGFGWGEFLYPGHVAYGHDGGGANVFQYFDREKLTIIVLTNQVGSKRRRPPSYDILEAVARVYLPDFTTLREALQRFSALFGDEGDEESAYAIARQLVEEFPEHAAALNWIAWSIVSTEGLDRRDLELALTAATRANEVTDQEDAAILDTLARVHFELGNVAEAVKWQRKAVTLAPNGEMGDEIRARLEVYLAQPQPNEIP